MQENGFSEQEAYDWMVAFMKRFNDHGMTPLSDILLPADSKVIVDFLREAAGKPSPWEGQEGASSGQKWPEQHMNKATSQELQIVA